MTISVAMCTFNGARFLRAQLESIARQRRPPDELVICDDGSSDGSVEILREFAAGASFSIRIFCNEKNLGSTQNFEKAIQLCKGDLIALCDQDDIWLPEKLSRLLQIFEQDSSVGGVFSDADLINENSQEIGKRLWQVHKFAFSRLEDFDRATAMELLLKQDVVTGATLMIRSSIRELLNPLPEQWVHDGWIAWMLTLYSRLAFVRDPLVQYRVHGGQQLGIGHRGLREKLQLSMGEDRKKLRKMQQQFEVLRERWIARPGQDFQRTLRIIEDKIHFLGARHSLPDGFLRRACSILASLRSYQHYARGLSSMRGDLFLTAVDSR